MPDPTHVRSQLLVRDRLGSRGAAGRPLQPHRARRGDPALPHRGRRRSPPCATAAAIAWRRSPRAGRKATASAAATTACCSTPPAAASRSRARRRVPAKARVQRYPVAVKNKWVFVWMGEPAKADPALLPDNFSCDYPGVGLPAGLPALLDAAAADLRQPARLLAPQLRAREDARRLDRDRPGPGRDRERAARHPGHAPGARRAAAALLPRRPPASTGNLDRWFIYDFVLPGTLLMHSGGRPVGRRRRRHEPRACACTAARR